MRHLRMKSETKGIALIPTDKMILLQDNDNYLVNVDGVANFRLTKEQFDELQSKLTVIDVSFVFTDEMELD